MVDVKEYQRKRAVVTLSTRHLIGQCLLKLPEVIQSGHRVTVGQSPEVLLQQDALKWKCRIDGDLLQLLHCLRRQSACLGTAHIEHSQQAFDTGQRQAGESRRAGIDVGENQSCLRRLRQIPYLAPGFVDGKRRQQRDFSPLTTGSPQLQGTAIGALQIDRANAALAVLLNIEKDQVERHVQVDGGLHHLGHVQQGGDVLLLSIESLQAGLHLSAENIREDDHHRIAEHQNEGRTKERDAQVRAMGKKEEGARGGDAQTGPEAKAHPITECRKENREGQHAQER